MSNSIRKPRRRPRVASCSFRSLGWLIRREAAWAIITRAVAPSGASAWRTSVACSSWARVARLAESYLRHSPERRYYP